MSSLRWTNLNQRRKSEGYQENITLHSPWTVSLLYCEKIVNSPLAEHRENTEWNGQVRFFKKGLKLFKRYSEYVLSWEKDF